VRLNSRPVVIAAAILGILLIALAFYYWAEPAHSLPSWLPGHEAVSNHHHAKHGIASFLVGVALLVFAWFQSNPRRERPDA
jgi:ammonia channel protein AmtB